MNQGQKKKIQGGRETYDNGASENQQKETFLGVKILAPNI